MATTRKLERTERDEASEEAAVCARSSAGSALLGLEEPQAATKSAQAWCRSSAVRWSGVRLSRRARETTSSRPRSGASPASFTVSSPLLDYENRLRGCQLAFRKAFRIRQGYLRSYRGQIRLR